MCFDCYNSVDVDVDVDVDVIKKSLPEKKRFCFGCYNNFTNKYKFISKIHDTVLSKIYLVEDKKTGNEFICKRIPKKNFRLEEITIPKILKSEKIVNICEVYTKKTLLGDLYYYVLMKYHKNSYDLFDYFKSKIPDENILKKIVKEMAICMKVCHDKNITHMDIKAENFVVICENPIKLILIDFGGSQFSSSGKIKKNHYTIMYSPPEFMFGKFSVKSDIWSLGIVIYYMYTGKEFIHSHNSINWDKNFECREFSVLFKNFLFKLINLNPTMRYNIDEILNHPWLH